MRSGGERPNFDEAFLFWNGLVPGDFLFSLAVDTGTLPVIGNVVENPDVTYQFDTDPSLTDLEAELNGGILRLEADSQARHPAGLAGIPPVTGRISVPVLSLHNLGDLFVPFHNEIVYAEDVAAAGRSELLVQRAIRGVNHCEFTPEAQTAFDHLVAWVEDGVVPEGDVVLDPVMVAEPTYGCAFTENFAHPKILATPCPGGG